MTRDTAFRAARIFGKLTIPGTAQERRRPEGQDDGFLWRLNSYWSFTRVRGGLQMECEAVSLTRDVPLGLGWLITPIIGRSAARSVGIHFEGNQERIDRIRRSGGKLMNAQCEIRSSVQRLRTRRRIHERRASAQRAHRET